MAALCSLCYVLDIVYDKRPIQRFWFLEVVARMPYFSYISMLHLYESLGWWRAGAALRKVSARLVYILSYSQDSWGKRILVSPPK